MLSSFIFIFSKNADIAVAPLTVTESREKVIDFMMPYMYFTEDMLIRKETSKEEVDYLQFMNPFENAVWFCTLATLVIISIAVFVINYFSPYGYKQEDGKGTSEEFNYFNSLWFSVACMLQQGGDNTPRSLSGKLKNSFKTSHGGPGVCVNQQFIWACHISERIIICFSWKPCIFAL